VTDLDPDGFTEYWLNDVEAAQPNDMMPAHPASAVRSATNG
jgi:hypothetical protein